MVLNEINEPLNSTQLSQIIAKRTKGQLFKISAALKDSLEHRLKREGYVEGIDCTYPTRFTKTGENEFIFYHTERQETAARLD
jgi:hypothetical protein